MTTMFLSFGLGQLVMVKKIWPFMSRLIISHYCEMTMVKWSKNMAMLRLQHYRGQMSNNYERRPLSSSDMIVVRYSNIIIKMPKFLWPHGKYL